METMFTFVDASRILEEALYARDPDERVRGRERQIAAELSALAERAFVGEDATAEARAHELLYRINIAGFGLPWNHAGLHPEHPLVCAVRYAVESAWERRDRAHHGRVLANLPSVEDFPEWTREVVQAHASNVGHPLFRFLRDEATYEELRYFFLQETPFDIFFGDLLTLMMPGVYGAMKVELCRNFWDEMGHATEARMHRSLRRDMMAALDIPLDNHLERVEDYCMEELRLANMYFDAAHNRRKLPQALGMMLGTELMVPGRLEYQIHGWRRVGLRKEALTYLEEHTVVDVHHAHGWMENVVMPLLRRSPALMPDIALGMHRRLENAGAVCDRMFSHLSGRRDARRPVEASIRS